MMFGNIYRVKEVTKILDRDRTTIFRWEKEGRIPAPGRDSRGWRIYTDGDLERMRKLMQELSGIMERDSFAG
ncbi:MAG: MerR family transcriptional regulator [Candidatus Moranbacteria bacterium]|nr:MerR family transcriptional regulator [Candidatus Moranbacteria bacterium]